MKSVTAQEMLLALRQLAALARLGYPLAEAVEHLSDEASPWLLELSQDLQRGDTPAQALARQPRLFSPPFRALLEAASHTQLEELCLWLERSQSLQNAVGRVLLYPVLLLALVLLLAAAYLGLLMPQAVFPLLLETGWLTASGVQALAWLALLPLLLFVPLAYSTLKGQPWRPLQWLFPELVGIGQLGAQAFWARGLGALLATGVAVPEAIERSMPMLSIVAWQPALLQAAERARRGSDLASALAPCGLEPALLFSLSGENPAARVLEAAEVLEHEVELRARFQTRMMLPRAMVFVGLASALTVLIFWVPYYAGVSQLG